MSTTDTNGRPYAVVADTKPGDKLIADGGFTCIPEGTVLEVKQASDGLYVQCNGHGDFEGIGVDVIAVYDHGLDGQEENGVYLGLYRAEDQS